MNDEAKPWENTIGFERSARTGKIFGWHVVVVRKGKKRFLFEIVRIKREDTRPFNAFDVFDFGHGKSYALHIGYTRTTLEFR